VKYCKVENIRILIETIVVIGITIILFIKFNKYNSLISCIPIVFFLIERKIRHRSWADVGFNINNTLINLRENRYLIIFAAIILPMLTFFIAKYFKPEYITYVKSRLPLNINAIITSVITIAIGTFLEEIIFRGFIQERIGWFTGAPIAIVIASILFALMHISKGSFDIIAIDLAGIFIDSLFFGIIFLNTNNIFASWISHFLSDLTGLLCLLIFT
jgi:uncharacterized protein